VSEMKKEIELPEEMDADMDGDILRIRYQDSAVENKFKHPLVDVRAEDGKIVLRGKEENKKVKAVIGTFESKIENALKGLEENFEYRMKVIYRHFPMDVSARDDELVVNNFVGEKEPRRVDIPEGVEIEVQDEDIYVRGPDIEKVGQTAADIEQKIRVHGKKDKRVFQDGIYSTQKSQVRL